MGENLTVSEISSCVMCNERLSLKKKDELSSSEEAFHHT